MEVKFQNVLLIKPVLVLKQQKAQGKQTTTWNSKSPSYEYVLSIVCEIRVDYLIRTETIGSPSRESIPFLYAILRNKYKTV
jgi:hypothetical protein